MAFFLAHLLLAGLTCLTLPTVAHAATATLKLSPTSGLPTSSVSGFGASEQVKITFNKTLVHTTTPTNSSTFSTTFTVPKGAHTVTASGQSSGRTASAPFQVLAASWPNFGFDAGNSRFNPYENILNTSNVSSLTKAWSASPGSFMISSPAVVNGVLYVGASDNNVYAFNATDSSKLWSFTTGNMVDSSPAMEWFILVP